MEEMWQTEDEIMSTIEVRAIDIIETFVLTHYADGYSIIQELVQNANDASATDMIFSFLPKGITKNFLGISVKKANNPLLNNPLFIVLNDGPFLPKDAKYISSLGVGSKSNDNTSIGKFGLGMKSIFHLCDAFFYFTTDGKNGKFINPYIWEGKDNDHPTWNYNNKDEFISDFTNLNNAAMELIKDKSKPYFCLVIPLRLKSSPAPHLKTTFLDNKGLSEIIYGDKTKDNLDEFLLMMLSVLSVTSKKKTLKNVLFKSNEFSIQCSLGNNTIKVDDQIKHITSDSSILCTQARIPNGAAEKLKLLQSASTWPSDANKLNVEDSSIILIKTPSNGKSELEISYASYLPLKTASQIIRTNIDSKYSYRIIFNGPFFIDSGRNGIDSFSEITFNLAQESYDFPEDTREFQKYTESLLSKEKTQKIWNTILLRDVLYASLPYLFVKPDNTIRENDYLAIFEAFKNSSLDVIHRFATKACFIPCELKENGGYSYSLSQDYNALLIPDPGTETLTKNKEFVSLLKRAVKPSRLIFTDLRGKPLGLIHSDNISRQQNLGIVFNIFEGLSNEYYELLSKPTFRNYLKRFLSVVLSDIEITDEYTANSIIFFIKEILRKMTLQDNIVGIPNDFIDIIDTTVASLCDTVPIYICAFENSNAKILREFWRNTNTNILMYPASKMSKERKHMGTEVNDLKSYLLKNVKPLMNTADVELAGSIFEATVTPYINSNEFSSAANISLLADVFREDKIIPAWKYSSIAREHSYISFDQINTSYKEVAPNEQKDITLFFKFAPQHDPIYTVDTNSTGRFNISEDILNKLSLSQLVLNEINDNTYLIPDYFEEIMMKILDYDTSEALQAMRIFPTISGRFTSMIGNDVYIDCREQNRYEIHGTSGLCRIVRIESNELRSKMMKAYKSNILNDKNFLDIYLKSETKPDKRVIFACRNNWDLKNTDLIKKPWFHLNDEETTYPCSNIVLSAGISEETKALFNDVILFVDKDQIEADECLEYLFKNQYIGRKPSDIPDEIIHRKFSGMAPLFNYGASGKAEEDKTISIYDALINSQYNITDKESIHHKWGCFLNDVIRTENLTGKEANKRFVDYNNKIHNDNAKFMAEEDIVDVLSYTSGNYSAFIYIIKLIYSKNMKLNISKFSNIRFPSESGEWKALYSLCNPIHYPTLETKYQLSKYIPVDLFTEPEHYDDLENEGSLETLDINNLRGMYPGASEHILGMLLFISNKKQARNEALDLLIAKKSDEFYLTYIKPGFTYMSNLTNHFCSLTMRELFSVEPQRVSKPSIRYVRNEFTDSDSKASVHSITGKKISVSFSNQSTYKSIFSAITRGKEGTTCHINPWNDDKTVDDKLIELINKLLNEVYKKKTNFSQYLAGLKSSTNNQMKTTQNYIKKEILSILKVAPYKKGNPNGNLLDDYKNRSVEYNFDLSEAILGSDSYNDAIVRISKLEDEIVNKLKTDDSFAKYFMSILSAHASEVSYDDNSVPFEFFQNADDALLQLLTYSNVTERFFTLKLTETTLTFEHNGRPINSGSKMGGHKEWNHDLINMLTFSSSKQHSADVIETGKFGFGFKSCYFLSEEPQIYSGALSAKIIGGVYPDSIAPAVKLNPGVTRFNLPLKQSKLSTVKKEVIPIFNKNAEYLLLFAKAINKLTINGTEYVRHTLCKNGNYSIERINDNLFFLITQRRVCIAFKIDKNKHIARIPEDISRVWCTTPLDIHAKHNYLINSSELKVDLGRTMIDMNLQGNKDIVREISNLFSQLLSEAYNNTLPSDIGKYISTGIDLAKDIIDASIAAENTEVFGTIFSTAYTNLLRSGSMMYNGFQFKQHTSDSTYIRISYLNGNKNDNEHIKDLEKLAENHAPDKSIILVTRDILLPEKTHSIECDTFVAFIEQMKIQNSNLEPSSGNRMWGILSTYPHLHYDFSNFKFKNIAGGFCNSHELVSESDELIYNFAPSENKIDKEYTNDIIGKFSASPRTIGEWILNAKGMTAKKSALIYFARFNYQLIDINELFDASNWLKKEYKNYISDIPSTDANTLEYLLGEHHTTQINPESYLDKVYSTWNALSEKERKEAIEKYRLKHFGSRKLELSPDSPDWYKLLYVAALGSMGRVRPETNLIFVKAFMNLGKLKKNALSYNENPLTEENAKKWMDYIVMSPVNENAEIGTYEEWRKYLPLFAQISSSALLLYRLFTTIPDGNETYFSRLDVEHDPEFSNTGLKGPNFKHTLGKYYPIILRELCSNDVDDIDTSIRSQLNKESFFPTQTVREKLGLDMDTKKNSDAFYDKCRNFIIENEEYTEYLNDGMYPFYYYENRNEGSFIQNMSIFDINDDESFL